MPISISYKQPYTNSEHDHLCPEELVIEDRNISKVRGDKSVPGDSSSPYNSG